MIGGLSLWVPNEAVAKGSPEVHDHVEPINLRVSPPARIQQPNETPTFRIDGLSVSAEGARLAATQGSPGGGSHELGIPRSTTTDHSANQRLAARDRAVRAHESAHRAHAGRYAGAPTYTLNEALMVELHCWGQLIDMQPVPNNPAATVQKMQVLNGRRQRQPTVPRLIGSLPTWLVARAHEQNNNSNSTKIENRLLRRFERSNKSVKKRSSRKSTEDPKATV